MTLYPCICTYNTVVALKGQTGSPQFLLGKYLYFFVKVLSTSAQCAIHYFLLKGVMQIIKIVVELLHEICQNMYCYGVHISLCPLCKSVKCVRLCTLFVKCLFTLDLFQVYHFTCFLSSVFQDCLRRSLKSCYFLLFP